MKDIKEKTIKGFLGSSIYKIIDQGFSWVLFVILVRILYPEDFGLMALATFFINFFNFISEFGLGSALIQKEELNDEEINSSFWCMVLFNLAVYVVILILSHPIGVFYNNEELVILTQVLGLNFIISSLRMTPFCLLTRELEFLKVAKSEFYSHLLSSIIILVFALLGFRVWSLVIGSILQNFFSLILMFYYRPWWPRRVFKLKKIEKMLSFGISVNTSKILTYVTDNFDNLIIGKVLGEKSLGFYNRAFTLGTMPIQKSSSIIYRISFPVFSRLQDDRVMLRDFFLKINKYISLLAFPSMIGLLLISDSFVKIVLGERWMPIILPLKILCGVGIIKSLSITLSPLLYSKGKANTMLKYSFLCALIMPLAFYAGAKFGINGVAIAWIVVYPFIFFYLLRLVLREINLSIYNYMGNLSHAFMGTIFMAAMVVIFQYSASANGYVQLIGSCIIGLLSYSTFLILVSKKILSEFKDILYSLRTRKTQA